MRILIAFACIALSTINPASAQSEPATIWSSPSEDGDKKFFAFYRQSIGAARAKADIAECFGFANAAAPFIAAPKIALIGDASTHKDAPPATGPMFGGVIPSIALGLIQDGFQSKMIRGSLRRCMSFKGYKRYALSKEKWEWAYEKGFEVSRLTELAAGNPPSMEALEP